MVESVQSDIPEKSGNLPENPPSPAIPSENASLVEHQEALSTRSKTLQQLIRRILPKHCPRKRDMLQKTVELSADGVPWKDIERKTGVKWIDITCISRNNLKWRELWHTARAAGEDQRKEIRLSEAHRRAVDGWKEPVFFQGKKCGSVQRFSDKLHELLLKADDPARFADHSKVEHSGSGPEAGGIVVNFIGVEFGKQPPPKVYNVPEKVDLPPSAHKDPPQENALQGKCEGQSATNPLPKPTKQQKRPKT